MNRMDPLDVAWLAGMIEGEAAIGCWSASGREADIPSKHTKYAKVAISSADKEVLERILVLTGVGSIVLHYGSKTKKKDSHKQSWTWTVGKAEDVIALLNTVLGYGYFSQHRMTQILEAIEAASETAARKRSGESFSRKKQLSI